MATDSDEPATGLEGAWAPIAASRADESLPVAQLRVRYLLLSAGGYRIVDTSNRVVDSGRYRADPQRSPPTLDISGEAGPNAGRTLLALYQLRGDELTVCYNLEGAQRPADMEPRRNVPTLRITYTRAAIALS